MDVGQKTQTMFVDVVAFCYQHTTLQNWQQDVITPTNSLSPA